MEDVSSQQLGDITHAGGVTGMTPKRHIFKLLGFKIRISNPISKDKVR